MAKDTVTILLIIGAILLANSAGVLNLGGLLSTTTPATPEQEAEQGTLCLNDGAVMTIGPVEYRYNPATSVTNLYHRAYVDGVNRGLKADGSTMDVTTPTRIGGSDGAAVELYYAENATGFYAAKHAFSVPCVSAFASGARPDSDAYQVIANNTASTLTMTLFNDDDGLKNYGADTDGATNESISADDSANVQLKINFGGKRGFSPYGKAILSYHYNSTAYDKIEITSSDTSVTQDADVPTFRQSANSTIAGMSIDAVSFPGVEGLTTSVYYFNVYIESSSLDPVHSTSNITFFLDDEDYYLDTDTGKMVMGAENNDNTDIGDTKEHSARLLVN